VQLVEMRDIVIPSSLQEAMSREAQAAREKAARIILGEAEMEIAKSFESASRVYAGNPTAFHLRAMNMLYEGLKEKGALMLVPSTAVESMGMGGFLGAAALRQATLTGGAEEGSSPPRGTGQAAAGRPRASGIPSRVFVWVRVSRGHTCRGAPRGTDSRDPRRSQLRI
jgi:hypothetical protein